MLDLKRVTQPAKAGIYVKDKDGSKIVLGFRSAIGCRSALRFHQLQQRQKACCPSARPSGKHIHGSSLSSPMNGFA
jgi:hypothetical protein